MTTLSLMPFLNSAQEAGYPFTSDVNGFQQEGFGKFDQTIYRSRRYNAARAYIYPIKHKKNLYGKNQNSSDQNYI